MVAIPARWSADDARAPKVRQREGGEGPSFVERCVISLAGSIPVAAVVLVTAASLVAQDSVCEPDLLTRAEGPLGYRLRGDRCEGLYARPVAGTSLYVISLTEYFEDFDPLAAEPLHVAWSAPDTGQLRLRAEGTERLLYYRMDAVSPPGSSQFEWPTGVLGAQRITRDSLGIVAWTNLPVGGVERDVYVPLSISQRTPPARCGEYVLLLWTGLRLREVYVTLGRADSSGAVVTLVRDNEPLSLGYYPAEWPIRVELNDLAESGIYLLKIAADTRDGATRSIEHWIYHPAEPSAPCERPN